MRLQLDNKVAVSYIQHMGGRCDDRHGLTRTIWEWCIDRNIWLSAVHIPGSTNCEADALSRVLSDDMEWKLHTDIFADVSRTFASLRTDLFASRLNCQLPHYASYMPDPQACAVDAFTIPWIGIHCYAFPPFSILTRVFQKVGRDSTERLILVAPLWPTQVWFPVLLRMLSGASYILPSATRSLHHPTQPTRQHPLRKMRLGVFQVSGQPSLVKAYQTILPNSSQILGGQAHTNSMGHISRSGCVFATKGKLIHLDHLII